MVVGTDLLGMASVVVPGGDGLAGDGCVLVCSPCEKKGLCLSVL